MKPSPTTPYRPSTARPGDEIAPTSYRKKPVVIEAIRWSGTNLKEVIDFTSLHPSADKWAWEEYAEVVRERGLKIFSLEGSNFIVTKGDYIIKGVKGEFYACKPDIFWMTYERANVPASENDAYVGWCRHLRNDAGETFGFEACDSDSPGAFKVYRHPSATHADFAERVYQKLAPLAVTPAELTGRESWLRNSPHVRLSEVQEAIERAVADSEGLPK